MLNRIIEQFKLVKDFRQSQGKIHELWGISGMFCHENLLTNI